MTIDEAIEELGTLFVPRDGEQDRLADAQEMAIRSLEAMKKLHEACYTNGLRGDAFCDEVCDILNEFEEVIENL